MRSLECNCLIFSLLSLSHITCAWAQNQQAENVGKALISNTENTWEDSEHGKSLNADDAQQQQSNLKHLLQQKLQMEDETEGILKPPRSQQLRAQYNQKDAYDGDGNVDGENGKDEEEEDEDDELRYDPYRDNFYDLYDDGTYVYGYSLPHGVRRFERSFYSDKFKGLIVEGFYTEARHRGHQLVYELRCYRSDYWGYRPLRVQYLRRPPVVQRDVEPNVNCFD